MRWVPLALLIILCWLPATAHAQKRHRDAPCTAANARPISIADASRGGKEREGKCARITGIVDFWTVYGSVGDIYRATKIWGEHNPGARRAARIGIGLFPVDDDGNQKWYGWTAAAPRRITLVGRLHECGRDPETGEPYGDFVMELNWCHHNGGTVINPVAILADDSVDFTRMTGRRAWQQFGDIKPAESGSAFAVNARAYLEALFDAARRGDRRELLDLGGYSQFELAPDGVNVKGDGGQEAQEKLDFWLGDSTAVISQTRRNSAAPVVRIFEPRWKVEAGADGWACWAPGPLAERDWPISSIDTNNVVGRPYACVELFRTDKVVNFKVVKLDDIDFAWVMGPHWFMAEPWTRR